MDLPATLLDYFGVTQPTEMQGRPLAATIRKDSPVREAGLFGLFGGQVNVTDGRFVYMRAPAGESNAPLNRYTLMPMHMANLYSPEQLHSAELGQPFSFTKGVRPLRIPAHESPRENEWGTLLYDLQEDPAQQCPLDSEGSEKRMVRLLREALTASDAPTDQFERLGIPRSVDSA